MIILIGHGLKKISWDILTIVNILTCQKILPNTLKKKKWSILIKFTTTVEEIQCKDRTKYYQTVNNKDFRKYPANEKKEVVGGLVRNFNRKDLLVEKKVVNEYFKS